MIGPQLKYLLHDFMFPASQGHDNIMLFDVVCMYLAFSLLFVECRCYLSHSVMIFWGDGCSCGCIFNLYTIHYYDNVHYELADHEYDSYQNLNIIFQ